MHALHTPVTVTGAGPTFDGRQGTIVNSVCIEEVAYQVKFADTSGLISDRFWFSPAEVKPIHTEVCRTTQSRSEVRRSVQRTESPRIASDSPLRHTDAVRIGA